MARTAGACGLALVLALTAGCNVLGPIAYYLGPQRIQKPEYKLSETRPVALVIEAASPAANQPVFNETLSESFLRVMSDKKSKVRFVPPRQVAELRRRPDYASWSLQRIGRELEASEVLHVLVEELVVRENPVDPVISPRVLLRIKVIGVDQPSRSPRLWPDNELGQELICTRPPQEALTAQEVDAALIKLARDTSHRLAVFFTETDLETPLPTER